ncbi:hypothetical protein ACFLZZ_02370 [Nanoarchaeota archaeon]
MATVKEVEDKLRDLINFVEIKKGEQLEAGEGQKIEDDTSKQLTDKLREVAELAGQIQ